MLRKIFIFSMAFTLFACMTPVKPPEYIPEYGGMPILKLASSRSKTNLDEVKKGTLAIVPTKNTENLVPIFRQCAKNSSEDPQLYILAAVNPVIGIAALKDQKAQAEAYNDPVGELASKTLDAFKGQFKSATVFKTIGEALKEQGVNAVAFLDLTTTKGCSKTALPDNIVFKTRIYDRNLGLICDVEKEVSLRQAWDASDMKLFETKEWAPRVLKGYFNSFNTEITKTCS